MIKETGPALACCLRQKPLLHFERLYRIKIVAHDPGKRDMSSHRHEVSETKQGLSFTFESPALHRSIVPWVRFHPQAWHYLVVRVLQFQLIAREQRPPVVRQITGTVSFAGSFSVLYLSTRNEIPGIGKRGQSFSVSV